MLAQFTEIRFVWLVFFVFIQNFVRSVFFFNSESMYKLSTKITQLTLPFKLGLSCNFTAVKFFVDCCVRRHHYHCVVPLSISLFFGLQYYKQTFNKEALPMSSYIVPGFPLIFEEYLRTKITVLLLVSL